MSRNMRLDSEKTNINSNGTRHHPNGTSPPSIQKTSQSGSSNGHAHSTNSHFPRTNGSATRSKPSSFFGHDREEITRLLIQALGDLGYRDSANRLVQESGYELEGPMVAAFRHAILDGEWSEAEALLFGSRRPADDDGGGVSINDGASEQYDGLVLAEGVDKNLLRFRLRRQKYLELLEERDHSGALTVLRQELTPLHQDVAQLHILSGYAS